jgi:hypothetical protein
MEPDCGGDDPAFWKHLLNYSTPVSFEGNSFFWLLFFFLLSFRPTSHWQDVTRFQNKSAGYADNSSFLGF